MSVASLNAAIVPPRLAATLCLRQSNLPRFFATVWIDVIRSSLEPSTRRGHLSAVGRFYDAVRRQRGVDCLDRLIADAKFDALEECLVGFLAQLLEKVTHGWAISVHKAQGSAFRRVIIPLVRSKLLDRSMLYTAITRGIETVVLVGDPEVIKEVVRSPPKTLSRGSSLSFGA